MLLHAGQLVDRLRPGTTSWVGGASRFAQAGAAEGGFRFERISVGVFLNPLPSHRTRHADGRVRSIPIAEGHGWLFPAGFDGWCAWEEDNAYLTLELDAAAVAQAGPDAAARAQSFRPIHGALDPTTVSLALQLHAAGDAAPRLYRETLTVALAAQALSHAAAEIEPPRHDPRIQRALDLMEARLAEDVSLEDLAAAAAMSPFHFARAFKAAIGRPPHQELVARRLERAKALLRATKLPVADIAFQVGWRDASRFTAAFKRAVGATPGAWRAGSNG